MAMGREGDRQCDLIVSWAEMPRSPGHVFYDRLQEVLISSGFDRFVETTCQRYYAPKMGAPSVPPGRYFRMHMVGYFEGIASERGIAWRCSDSMSLREFLRLESREEVPDHSWLSKTRGRLSHEVHETVFSWVLKLVAEQGLVKGKRIGRCRSSPRRPDAAAADRASRQRELNDPLNPEPTSIHPAASRPS
jgi:transposase